jgi:hypothetical protein
MAEKSFKPKTSIDLDGSTSGTVTISAPAVAGTSVVTLPAATDTLVGKATTDTLTNKSISGSTNTLSAIANASLTNSSVTIQGTGSAAGGSTQSVIKSYGAVSLGSTLNIPIRTIFIDTTANFNSTLNPYSASDGDIVIVYTP